jgi:hypothetical protein
MLILNMSLLVQEQHLLVVVVAAAAPARRVSSKLVCGPRGCAAQ